MPYAVSLADLRRGGGALTADEAVAIARQLIEQPADAVPLPPFGPLAADRLRLASDGSVACAGCAATPTVAEVAILLQELLDRTPHVPGGLRYLIARALHEVDAPPFDSLPEFAAALARYGPARADEVVRRIVARRDRRSPSQSTADLRMHLREADRRLYEAHARVATAPPPPEARVHGWIAAALFVGALTTIAAASVVGDRVPEMPAPPPAPPLSAASASIEAPAAHPVLVTPVAHRSQTNAKAPVREPQRRVHALRLRWLHTTIAIKDDLAR